MWAVNECFAEMVSYLPVPSPFIRFGGEWVDGALGFAMAWNFFLNMVRDKEGNANDVETRADFGWSLYRPSWYLSRSLVSLRRREKLEQATDQSLYSDEYHVSVLDGQGTSGSCYRGNDSDLCLAEHYHCPILRHLRILHVNLQSFACDWLVLLYIHYNGT
jgi:hypothetical protein